MGVGGSLELQPTMEERQEFKGAGRLLVLGEWSLCRRCREWHEFRDKSVRMCFPSSFSVMFLAT